MTADVEIWQHKYRRLKELEKQEAQLGVTTPPHILTEIDGLRGQLSSSSELSSMANATIPLFLPDGRLATLEADVKAQGQDINELKQAIGRIGWAALISAIAAAISVINLLLILLLIAKQVLQ